MNRLHGITLSAITHAAANGEHCTLSDIDCKEILKIIADRDEYQRMCACYDVTVKTLQGRLASLTDAIINEVDHAFGDGAADHIRRHFPEEREPGGKPDYPILTSEDKEGYEEVSG